MLHFVFVKQFIFMGPWTCLLPCALVSLSVGHAAVTELPAGSLGDRKKNSQNLEIRVRDDSVSFQCHMRRHCFVHYHYSGWVKPLVLSSWGPHHPDHPFVFEVGGSWGRIRATPVQKGP